MKKQGILAALCGIIFLLASCDKNNNPSTAPYTYSFQNNTGKHINIDIYQTADDYNNNRNAVLHGSANPGQSYQVSNVYLQTNIKYYIDWYSDDYTYSNWVNRTDLYENFDPTIMSTAGSDLTKMQIVPEYARILCLGGGGTGTTWRAVDGFTYLYNGGSGDSTALSQLPAAWQTFTLTFHKDFSATYSYTTPNGQPGSVTIFCRTDPNGVPIGSMGGNLYFYKNASIFDMNGQLNKGGKISYGFNAPFGSPEYALKDTIQVEIDGVGNFAMVKAGQL
jgi:hypothetical protein